MKTISAKIAEQNLIITPSVISVAESVGAYSIKIEYDDQWNDVDSKIVTFRGANGASFAIQDNGEESGVVIPWEVLLCPGKVSVGVVGYIGTTEKLTTTGLYDRNTFVVLPEACGLKSAMTPSPDIYQKLLQTINKFNEDLAKTNENIGDLANLETDDKTNLVNAINEVLKNAGKGSNDFNELANRPKYKGQPMTGDTDIPSQVQADWQQTDDSADDYIKGLEGVVTGMAIGSEGNAPVLKYTTNRHGEAQTSTLVTFDEDQFVRGSTGGELSINTDAIQEKLQAGEGIEIDGNTIKALTEGGGGGGSTSGAKVLTSADYNWNSSTKTATEPFDSVALWLLEPGLYTHDETVTVYRNTANTLSVTPVLVTSYSNYAMGIIWSNTNIASAGGGQFAYTTISKAWVSKTGSQSRILYDYSPVATLESTENDIPLAASQGKALNDKITAINNQLDGLESALNTINNGGQN